MALNRLTERFRRWLRRRKIRREMRQISESIADFQYSCKFLGQALAEAFKTDAK